MRLPPDPSPWNGPALTGIGAVLVGISGFFTAVFGWRKSLRDRVDDTIKDLWVENRALREEMVGLRHSNDLLQASNRELIAKVEALLMTHAREIDHLKEFYQNQIQILKGHVDTSVLLLQASSAVPELMNRDDIRELQTKTSPDPAE